MKILKLLFLLAVTGLFSCQSEYTYDVRIVNNSGAPIQVDYKSDTHLEGPIQRQIIINNEQSELIISTKNLDKNIRNVCDSVADYIKASQIKTGQISSLEWCDPNIKLELVDIGQYQYLMEFKKEHFKG